MHRYRILAATVIMPLGLSAFCATAAHGQVVIRYSAPVAGFPVMGPPVIPAPVFPVAPRVTYYQPAPTIVYTVPRVSYYQPVTVYSPPRVSTGGVYVRRSYRSFGIFRPRGIYTSTYYQPTVTYSPGYRSSYYRAVIVP